MKDVRIAMVSMSSRPCDPSWNLERIGKLAVEACDRGAEIICFPELAVMGYGRGSTMRDLAQPIPGPVTDGLTDVARATQMTILVGLLEADQPAVYNSHVVVGPNGLLGRYRKTHIPFTERPAFDAGDERVLFDHPKVRFGIEICYDAHFPELSSIMAEEGAEILFLPHASTGGESRRQKTDRWKRFLPARAYDNGVFVAVCNASGTTADGEWSPGIGLVFDPLGRALAETHRTGEEILVVDLSAELLERARSDKDGFFRDYRRPAMYAPSHGNSIRTAGSGED